MSSEQCPGCGAALQASGLPIVTTCLGCRRTVASVPGLSHGSTQGGSEAQLARIALAPEALARWSLDAVIGRGSFRIVYAGKERSTGSAVAIKFLGRLQDAEGLTRFIREGEKLARISHANVVRILDTGQVEQHPYIVTELVEGGTLRDEMKRHAVNIAPKHAVRMAQECLAGLHACHQLGVVHRDLKPENILLTRANLAKIADLGIAKDYSSVSQVTQIGALIGTPRYMSPEQIHGEPAAVTSDIFAVVLILYEMLGRSHPFQNLGLGALAAFASGQEEVADLARRAPWVPLPLAAAVHAGLARRPGDRPSTAPEFADRLARAMAIQHQRTASAVSAEKSIGMSEDGTVGSFGSTVVAETTRFALGVAIVLGIVIFAFVYLFTL